MNRLKIVALAGGVGGAKLADGLAQVLPPGNLTVIVNTGDDFTHLGLHISPDLDTLCYTLAGLANPDTGWGRVNETWQVLSNLRQLGMPDWFQVGDADIATHIARTVRLTNGWSLSKITQDFCQRWGIKSHVFPMTDDSVQTYLRTDEGQMEFQEYFVHRQCKPVIREIIFSGVDSAQTAPGVLEAIHDANAIILCPSNPWVSIDPILAVPGICEALAGHLVVAVSPIIGGQTVKGPAAKMFTEFGITPSAVTVAKHYESILNGLFIDSMDAMQADKINLMGIKPHVTNIIMSDRLDRGRLAREIVDIL